MLIKGVSLKLPIIIIIGVLSTATGVAKDQAEADEDMSLKKRLDLATGSVLKGSTENTNKEIIARAMEGGSELRGRNAWVGVYVCGDTVL